MEYLRFFQMTALCLLTITGKPQTYEYHPKASLTLGYGIDIRNLSDGKVISPFKQPLKKEFENPNGTPATNFYQSLVLTEEDLMKSFGLDANINARYLTFNASASFKIDRREILSSDNLTILISAENNYGNQHIVVTKDDLIPDAAKLLNEEKYNRFINDYGNFIVNKVERKSNINIYLTIKDIDQQFKESISKKAKAGGSLGKFSGAGSISLNTAINKASKDRNFAINIQSNGDESGFGGLKNLIDVALSSTDPIAQITNTLKEYLQQFTRDNSPVSKYYLSSVSSLGIPNEFIQWNSTTEDQLRQIAKFYQSLDRKREILETIKSHHIFNTISTTNERDGLTLELKKINQAMTALLAIKDNCLSSCQTDHGVIECCNIDAIEDIETPWGDYYTKVFNMLSAYKKQTVFLNKGQEYVLIDEKINNLDNKKISFFSRFYFIPHKSDQIYEERWLHWIQIPVQLELRVNDKIYAQRPMLEKGEILAFYPSTEPVPILDQKGDIISYNNYWVYNLDDIPVDGETLKISIKFVDFSPNPSQQSYPFDQVKIHPNLFFSCDIKD